jgi:hypothetical protein
MSRIKTLQSLFKRNRRPGDIVFAWAALCFSVFLLSQLADQTIWKNGGKLFAQPRFWPAVSLWGMVVFSAFHLIGAALSPRIHGRWSEVWLWVTSLEYAFWFIVYAAVVPYLGYLPTTIIFDFARWISQLYCNNVCDCFSYCDRPVVQDISSGETTCGAVL